MRLSAAVIFGALLVTVPVAGCFGSSGSCRELPRAVTPACLDEAMTHSFLMISDVNLYYNSSGKIIGGYGPILYGNVTLVAQTYEDVRVDRVEFLISQTKPQDSLFPFDMPGRSKRVIDVQAHVISAKRPYTTALVDVDYHVIRQDAVRDGRTTSMRDECMRIDGSKVVHDDERPGGPGCSTADYYRLYSDTSNYINIWWPQPAHGEPSHDMPPLQDREFWAKHCDLCVSSS